MAGQTITPPPSPPPVLASSISAQINAATRQQHLALNRLITQRLPLALPPYQSDAALYGHGLAAFAEIYFAFEHAWAEAVTSQEPGSRLDGEAGNESELREWLATLRPQGLERHARLRNDLRHVSSCTGTSFNTRSLSEIRTGQRMRNEIIAKPHILIAYAWVMYMAIFSGGRWIRQELVKGGHEFWMQQAHYDKNDGSEQLSMPGFSFLSFDGADDGEHLKTMFKARLEGAETLLTQQQRQDVIDASQQLFKDCIATVGELDHLAGGRILMHKARPIFAGVLVLVGLYCLYCWNLMNGS